jgi:hypothetical protein
MKANTYPLQEILKPERRYVIPTFQRDYEWTRDGQWQLLFEDLENVADKLLEARNSGLDGTALSNREQLLSPHFMGAIVCAALPFATGGIALRSVIDGQQRLTTIQLLIRGLLDCLVESRSDREKSLRRMLFNPQDVVDNDFELYKLWPRRRDRELWTKVMADSPEVDENETEHLYFQARNFFAESCRFYAATEEHPMQAERLNVLVDGLSSLFKLVVIDLEDNDDAQVIFEVLNGRQTPLSPIDLVKNLLFLRSEMSEEDVDMLYNTYWTQFDDPWWKEEVGRGHAARGRRDVLLSVWLTVVKGVEANVGHLYGEAREHLKKGHSTEEILKTISDLALAYKQIYEPIGTERPLIATAYDRLTSLQITTAVPLFAWLRTLQDSVLTPEDHEISVRAVESWALRRAYVGAQTRGYGTHLTRVLAEAKNAATKSKNVAAAVIKGLREGALSWPSDDEVTNAFLTRKFYENISRSRIRMLLGAVDTNMRSENDREPNATVFYDDLEIEHIMPRGWEPHWPVAPATATNGGSPSQAAMRDLAVDRIGNLTLVTSSFNKELSNSAWAQKRPEFGRQHSLLINAEVSNSEQWDEASIEARARDLARHAICIWPSASALLSLVVDE